MSDSSASSILEAPSCYICMDPVQSASSLSQCHIACSSQNKACFICLMWWFAEKSGRKDGDPYRCPMCKVPSHSINVSDMPFHGLLSQLEAKYADRAGAASGSEMDSLSADLIGELENSADSGDQEFDIHYIAGVHVVSSSVTKYKVVWHSRDLQPGDEVSSWVELAHSVELDSKVQDFLKRWRLPLVRPVGFLWAHSVPERTRAGQWKCTHDGCRYSTTEESNCRKHAGAVHCPSFFDCPDCGEKCKTASNLGKHRARKHPPAPSAAAGADAAMSDV